MDERNDQPEPTPADTPEPEPLSEEPAKYHAVTLDWVNQRHYDSPEPNNR